MILTVAAAAAVAVLAVWMLAPLLSRRVTLASGADARLNELLEAKHAVYRSILDLELDRTVGKVSDADHLHLRRQHESEALEILSEIDRIASADGSSEDVLEREIAEARRRLRSRP